MDWIGGVKTLLISHSIINSQYIGSQAQALYLHWRQFCFWWLRASAIFNTSSPVKSIEREFDPPLSKNLITAYLRANL